MVKQNKDATNDKKKLLELIVDKLVLVLVYVGLFALAADDTVRHLTNLTHSLASYITAGIMLVAIYIIGKNY